MTPTLPNIPALNLLSSHEAGALVGDPKCACTHGKEGECGKEHHGYTGSKGFDYQWCYVAGGAASATTCTHVLKSLDHPKKGWKKCGADSSSSAEAIRPWTSIAPASIAPAKAAKGRGRGGEAQKDFQQPSGHGLQQGVSGGGGHEHWGRPQVQAIDHITDLLQVRRGEEE